MTSLFVRRARVIEGAKSLVALWNSPVIQGLSRQERNASIEATREYLIEAVGELNEAEALDKETSAAGKGKATPQGGGSPSQPASATRQKDPG
jgi:hypothetical protein